MDVPEVRVLIDEPPGRVGQDQMGRQLRRRVGSMPGKNPSMVPLLATATARFNSASAWPIKVE